MKRDKIKKNDLVDIWKHSCPKGEGLNYQRFMGNLIDDYPGETWDVVDIKTYNGEIVSVYAFSIHPWGRN